MVYDRMKQLRLSEIHLRFIDIIVALLLGIDFSSKSSINDGAMNVAAWFICKENVKKINKNTMTQSTKDKEE
jgi:hypothetical protein